MAEIKKEKVQKILEECPKQKTRIFVSMDEIGEKHDKIRGIKGVFDKAVKTLHELKEIRNKNLKIGTITTVSNFSSQLKNDCQNRINISNEGCDDLNFYLICRKVADYGAEKLKNENPQ